MSSLFVGPKYEPPFFTLLTQRNPKMIHTFTLYHYPQQLLERFLKILTIELGVVSPLPPFISVHPFFISLCCLKILW